MHENLVAKFGGAVFESCERTETDKQIHHTTLGRSYKTSLCVLSPLPAGQHCRLYSVGTSLWRLARKQEATNAIDLYRDDTTPQRIVRYLVSFRIVDRPRPPCQLGSFYRVQLAYS